MSDKMREALERIAQYDCDSQMIGVKCLGCRTCIADEALMHADKRGGSPEDQAEQFIRAAIDRAPEPLRRLGEYLTRVLDEDQWPTAERLLLGIATAPPAPVVPDGWKLVPVEPTDEMVSAMMTSRARDDEGTFPMLMDQLDYSGEHKSRSVIKAAYAAMLAAAPEVKP